MAFNYLTAVLTAVLSALLVYLLSNFAKNRGIFITPLRKRDLHQKPTPRVGGLAIVVAFLVTILAIALFWPDKLAFTDQKIWGIDKNLLGLIIALIVLVPINIKDDLTGSSWQIKLLVQVVAALIIAFFGVRIQWLSNPFGGYISLGSYDWLFLAFWLVILANVVNWLDGIDGLAGGVSAISLAVLFFLSVAPLVSQKENALLAAAGFGAVVGFLPFNLFGEKVFLGDTGSVFLGFLIGVIAVISGGKIATAFLVLAIPFLDALVVVVSRLIHRRSPFHADRSHLHHRLLVLGFKPYQVVLLFWTASLLFGLAALNSQSIGKFWTILVALFVMGGFVVLYSIGGKIIKWSKQNQATKSR